MAAALAAGAGAERPACAQQSSRSSYSGAPNSRLISAADKSDLAGVREALDAGADVNYKTDSKDTALTYTGWRGSAAVAKLLIERGGDVNVHQHSNDTPLALAIAYGHDEVAKLLIEHGADLYNVNNTSDTALTLAASKTNLEMVKFLADKIDVNARNKWDTALNYAAWKGRADIVRVLLDHGADMRSRNSHGATNLILASGASGTPELVKLLLEHGAEVDARNNSQATALVIASQQGKTDIARLLLEHGADVNAKTSSGDTPLTNATWKGQWDVARLLIARGADVNVSQEIGNTPLNLAARNGYSEIARLLLAAGADVEAKDKAGKTAMDFARAGHYDKVVALLDCAEQVSRRDDMPELSKDQQAALSAKDELAWDAQAAPHGWFKPMRKLAEVCDKADEGFPLVARKASAAIRADFSDGVKAAGEAPKAPTLEQGKYESNAGFAARVDKAKKEFNAKRSAYEAKIEEARAAAEKNKSRWLARVFLGAFDAPTVKETVYDANSQYFSVIVAGTGELSGGASFYLTLKDSVPNDQAPDFDEALKSAEASIRFSLSDGRFNIVGASLKVKKKDYAALPAAGLSAPSLAVVDLAKEVSALKVVAAPEVSVQVAQSPEMEAKLKELKDLQAKKANKDQLARLEKQISELRDESGGTSAPVVSDIDEPGFQNPPRPSDFALVVGVEDYQQNLPKADFAERDAESMRKYLAALGVPEQNVIVLKGSQATKSSLEGYLEEWLPKNVSPDSRLYFYYSGHGAPDVKDGSAYLVPWDGNPALLKSTAFPVTRLYKDLAQIKAKEVLVVMDACFSGAGGRSVLAKGARPLVAVKEDEEGPAGNITLLAAAKGDEITGALSDQGHGLFTYYFLKALRSRAADTQSLYDFVKVQVSQGARRQNREQDPVLRGAPLKF